MDTDIRHILLIQDNEDDARRLREHLVEAQLGAHSLETVERLSAAVERLQEGTFDVVLLDLGLLGSRGLPTLASLQAAVPDVPVLVLAGLDDEVIAIQSVREGAQDYLYKGEMSSRLLGRAIHRAIERHGTHQDLRERRDRLQELVTERTAELRASEERYRDLFENIPVGAYRSTPGGEILAANSRLVEILGCPDRETLLRCNARDFYVHVEDRQQKQADITASDEIHIYENRFRRYDGTLIWVQDNIRGVKDEQGQILYFEGSMEDITRRKEAEQALQRNNKRLEILHEIDQSILVSRSPEQTARSALVKLERVIPFNRATVVRFDFELEQFQVVAIHPPRETAVGPGQALPMFNYGQDIPRLRRNETTFIDDLRQLSPDNMMAPILKAEGVGTYFNVPLIAEGDLIGALNVGGGVPGMFEPEHVEIAREVADQLAVAMRQARTLESEREQRALAEALRETAEALSSSLDLNDVLDQILANLSRVVPYDAAEIMLLDSDRRTARLVRCHGYESYASEQDVLSLVLDANSAQNLHQMLETHQPVVVAATHTADGWIEFPETAWIRSSASAPIISEGAVLGFLTINSAQPDFFTGQHAGRLFTFAHQVAVAIRNAQLYADLGRYSESLEQAVEKRTAELRAAKDRAEIILDSSPDAVLLLGADRTIDTVNSAFCRTFGFAPEEAYGRRLSSLLTTDADASRLASAAERVAQKLSVERLELRAQRKDGTLLDADVALAPIPEGGSLSGIVCSVRDISALKDVERMKDAFITTATHELRTPLTSIYAFAELLHMREFTEERRQRYTTLIFEQAKQLSNIIDEMLDLARLEAGRGLDMLLEPIDVAELIRDVVEPAREVSSQHTIRVEGIEGLPRVRGNAFRLTQVVRNLVSNAVKYSSDGSTVLIRAATEDDYLKVSVVDEGIGLKPEQQAHLFEKFYRADPSSTKGTGLGLATSKFIIEEHGGSIWVESSYGTGSTFTFTVPLASAVGGVA